jgi:hypothetical protein
MRVSEDDTYDLRIAGGRAVWTRNSASSVSPPREILRADPVVEVVPEPVLGLLQLGALTALAGLRRQRREQRGRG